VPGSDMAGLTSADYTAIGTIGLAAVTFVTVLISIRLASREDHRAREVQAHSVQIKVSKGTQGVEPDRVTITTTIVNSGDFTITGVQAWLCTDWTHLVEMHNHDASEDFSGSSLMQDEAFVILKGESRVFQLSFQEAKLKDPYVITWWVDRWGARWENRLSRVYRLVGASRRLTRPIVARGPKVDVNGIEYWPYSEMPQNLGQLNVKYRLRERHAHIQALRARYGWKWPFAGFIYRRHMQATQSAAARSSGQPRRGRAQNLSVPQKKRTPGSVNGFVLGQLCLMVGSLMVLAAFVVVASMIH
jgi:hypothetical protein